MLATPRCTRYATHMTLLVGLAKIAGAWILGMAAVSAGAVGGWTIIGALIR